MRTRHSGVSHLPYLACALGLALHALPTQAETALRLVYDWSMTTAEPDGSGAKTTRGTFVARLTPTTLAVREGDRESIYDFAAGRIVHLDHASRERKESSLYAHLDFAEIEIQNRRFTGNLMRAFSGSKSDLVDDEIDLGITASPPAELKLRERRRGEERTFLLNRRERTSFVASDAVLPPGLVPGLKRLLAHRARLHPRVREELMKEPRLPKRLEFSWQPITRRSSSTWELREVAPEAVDAAPPAPPYEAKPLVETGVLEVAFRVRTGRAGRPPAAADYQARAERLLAEGRGLEALLVALELRSATGETPTALLRRARDESAPDPRAQAVAAALDLEQSDPKAALERLGAVDASGLESGHVLAILRAQQRLALGERGGVAEEELASALAVNPFLIGPLLDAAQIYSFNYRAWDARECYDAVRAISADAEAVKKLDERDAVLRRKYPDFF